jgi:hypothetical protein
MKAAFPEQSHTRRRNLLRPPPAFFAAERFTEALAGLGLNSLEAVFAFEGGRDLAKASIGRFRRRLQFELTPVGAPQPVKVFLKRYDRPPALRQLRHWFLHHGRRSFARTEHEAARQLAAAGINVPHTIACGERWGILFEYRSFLMTEEVEDSLSLERRLPPCFDGPPAPARWRARREFIRRLASFVKRFHETGYRHRDLYFSHVFYSDEGQFTLIDLARASRPFWRRRFQVKDIAQLHYSAPAASFSRTDRLRFYLAYAGRRRLAGPDKVFLRRVARKAGRMARHNIRHGIVVPFLGR